MAQNAPPSQDVQDIQFKLHDKFTIFPESNEVKSLVSLLAVSSAKGLLFAGNPHSKELKVFKLRDIVDGKTSGQELKVRVVNLPGEPKVLACSCDGSMLAVNYVLNNTGFLQIYQVDSFLTATPISLYNLPVAPESNVFALQMLWNPVIPNNIALILTDGSVAMFTLNNGQYDKVTLGKEHQVKAGCWSPKGKQIVFGFAEGKLQQFKPNLQPARAIPCPPGIHPGPFDCIAVHWLSTFQFAAIFLQRGQEMCPSLFIVNAPKAGQPSYINYYDVCYSAPGPRIQQLSFNHIAQWNLLLVTSANGVEVGVLGTKDAGDNPNWIQYTLLDEARIEMPLTESKDETYPLGFAFDTASSHQVLVGEKKLPVMPMIHVLSTHGHLVSYNFLNLAPNAVDVCSPPPPLNDVSGQFVPLKQTIAAAAASAPANQTKPQFGENKPPTSGQGFGDMTFSIGSNMVTSTPAIKDKPVPLFGTQPAAAKPTAGFGFNTNAPAASSVTTAPTNNKPSTGFGFGSATTTTTSAAQPFSQPFGGAMTTGTPFGGFSGTGFTAKPNEAPKQQPTQNQTSQATKNPEANKPLYTVPATFTPPSVQQTQNNNKMEQKTIQPQTASNKMNLNNGEIDEVVKQMIVIQIEAFEMELKHIRQQSKQLMENIGSPDEIKSYSKQLNDLQEILEQANDHEFEQDVQSLRHSMNESYAMLAECRTKLDLYNNPNLTRLSTVSSTDPTSRRQLAKLQSYVASNQNQLSQLNQLIDAQWSQYQDVVRRNSKNQMHIPCLDGIYQRMSKLKDLLARQRTKMNYIKTKLKQKGLNYKPPSEVDVTSVAVGALTKNQSTMESLADSILSMSLSQVVSQTQAKLSEDKLNAIRNFTRRQQQIAIIKPKRPDRIGLKSEVILETKLETERKQKEMAKKQQQQQQQMQQQQYVQQQQQMQQQQYVQQQQQQQQQQYAAYKQQTNMQKVVSSKPQEQQPNYQTQLQQQLLKPQATISTPQQQQPPLLAKPTASKPNIVSSQPPTFITPTSSTAATLSFGGNSSFVKTSISTSAPKTDETNKPIATSTAFTGFGMTTSQSSLSFNPAKPLHNTAAPNESKENQQPTNTPISFSAKVIGGNDAKPFGNLGNKTTTQTNAVQQTPAQGFAASTSSGFSAFANTKTTTQTSNQTKDDTKKPEEAPKQFGFATASSTATTTTSTSSATSTAPSTAFGGFGGSTKPATTAAPFSTPLFGSTSSTTTSTPFATLSSSSSFSFNANVSTTATTTASTKSVTTTTTTSAMTAATAVTAKPADIKTTQTAAASTASSVTVTSAATSFSFISPAAGNTTTVTSTKSTAAPNVTITSTGLPEPKPAATATTTSSSAPTPTATADPTDSLFGSLNICKPTAKEAAGDSSKPANIFSGFAAATSSASSGAFSFVSASGAGDGAKSFLGTTSTTGTTPSTGFSFVSAASTTPATTANIFGTSATAGTTAAATDTTTTTTTTATAVTSPAAASTNATTTSSFTFATAPAPATASNAGSLFGSLSLSSAATTAGTATTTSAPAAGNIFGGGSSVFGQTSTAGTTSTTTSIFGGGAAAASSAPSLFGSTAPATTTAATPGTGSIFGAAAAATPTAGGSVFGGIPKPDQSVFGTGLFGATAAATKSPAATGGSIFGGGSSTGFGGSTAAGSIFGGGGNAASPFGSTASANTAGSIFGAAAAATKPAEGGSIFGSPTQQTASSGGSLFGKSTFGAPAAPQTAGGIFGGAAAQSPTSGGFGASGGSIFGGSTTANTSASGGSIFGAAAAATAPAFGASPGFGSFSQPSSAPAFGSPSAGGFGAAATTGFGSPQQQGAFAKPVFGGPASFGSPQPAFGAQPTFGGAPTFGSPKGFGSFAATSPTATGFGAAAQASAAPKGNIFETLGSQDSGLSFGNLAHSTQAQQQKPAFGGSSFMNYRS